MSVVVFKPDTWISKSFLGVVHSTGLVFCAALPPTHITCNPLIIMIFSSQFKSTRSVKEKSPDSDRGTDSCVLCAL